MYSMKYFKNSGDHGARHEVKQSFTLLVENRRLTMFSTTLNCELALLPLAFSFSK